jgi:hypothetical protein
MKERIKKMTRGKVYTNLEFMAGGITEDQLIEFDKICGELREIFAKNRAAVKRKQKRRKKWYKNANAIRYGVLD